MSPGEWIGVTTGSLALVLAVRDSIRTHYQSKSIKGVFQAAYEAFNANNIAFNQLCEAVRSVDGQVKTVDARVIESQKEHGYMSERIDKLSTNVALVMLAPKKRGPRKTKDEGAGQ
jgi:hypothetical protein